MITRRMKIFVASIIFALLFLIGLAFICLNLFDMKKSAATQKEKVVEIAGAGDEGYRGVYEGGVR